MKIPFNKPSVTQASRYALEQVMSSEQMSGDGPYTKNCHEWFETKLSITKPLMTTSCTHALEMSAILAEIQPNDEVIMPSYTFVSTANAFVLRGAIPVFIDIRPDTMNMDEKRIEDAITEKTRAIVPVHYAGVGCEMDTILALADKYSLLVIEDAAQGVLARYKGQWLGAIGHMGCYSFHETKNFHCGEGGLLCLNDSQFFDRAEIIREKGTNRKQFFRGQVDKYSWVDVGSSYLPSELNAAFLYGQLQDSQQIMQDRMTSWQHYYENFKPLMVSGNLELPHIPNECEHNAHMFYFKCESLDVRNKLINHLKEQGIMAVFHYVPLHTSHAGLKFGRFHGEDLYTTRESERLVRLPLYYGMEATELQTVVKAVFSFFE